MPVPRNAELEVAIAELRAKHGIPQVPLAFTFYPEPLTAELAQRLPSYRIPLYSRAYTGSILHMEIRSDGTIRVYSSKERADKGDITSLFWNLREECWEATLCGIEDSIGSRGILGHVTWR